MIKNFRLEDFGYEVEIGRVAKQANGAVWLKRGGTIVLVTACSAESKDFPGFLPLSVDYRENYSAAGKIPGGYYKREGRPSDKEVLTSRLIDRAIRPLFSYDFFDQVQVLATVYSVDKEHAPNVMSLVAASLALTISDIPFMGPIGAVEVCRVDGKWVVNPPYTDSQRADVTLSIAGTEEGINMVEGNANEISEQEFIDALFLAHEQIKRLVVWQKEIQKEIGKTITPATKFFDWNDWTQRADTYLTDDKVRGVYKTDKTERNQHIADLKKDFLTQYETEAAEVKISSKALEYVFGQMLKDKVTELMFILGKRVDDRQFDLVRPITVAVGLLPFTHGSALFTRGSTQALVSTTLGGGQDEQKFEGLMDNAATVDGRFMLHYNFPPFSVGEVRPVRGPGRREVGHGYLAASAISKMLPSKEDFPYTIRIVADMLESDGSTSMATTCGSTMALMQAGVPIKKMVSGIAMGLLMNKAGDFRVLSDMTGFEDEYGLMDFKVTGTQDGITAIQMDIKYKGGLSREVFVVALEQARTGRLHILGEMQKVMTKPNATLSDLVPKLISFKINPDKIGAIIGTGGKTIREITEKTGTKIDIEADGLVKIFGGPDADQDAAVNWVKTLAGQVEIGSVWNGKVRRIVEFGMFVELVPGLDGLVHVSNIPREQQKTFDRDFKNDDVVKVEVVDYDAATGKIRLRMVK
ncbi:MAG TPA: polyribonucleotide nucleotidyltransferase [Candidatus Babeliales bacterium]|nr:polyribonucleotide nucleotidyltransferase [Candidatus Babeliales bacterium]